jgi:hypothetical protein
MSRVAKLELSIRKDGKREKIELGGVFTGKFQGNYGVSLTLPTGETGEDGYPVRDKIVAVKTASGRKLSIEEAFVNLIVYEAMEERAPYDGPGADKAPAVSEDVDF